MKRTPNFFLPENPIRVKEISFIYNLTIHLHIYKFLYLTYNRRLNQMNTPLPSNQDRE